jgi:hypothetical protein
MAKRVFISFLNDDDSRYDGYCELLEQAQSYVKIMLGRSILTLPYSRILKIKEATE